MDNKIQKIKSIEGVRAIAWFGVFFGHYLGAFYPNVQLPTDSIWLIRFLYAGSAQVRVFFLISGIVISLKYLKKGCWENALMDIVKRYFRLFVPIVFAELMVCLFMFAGWVANKEASVILGSESFLGVFNRFKPNLVLCIRESMIGCFLLHKNSYIGPLWTMTYEFLGSVLVLAWMATVHKSKLRWLIYAIFLYAFSGYYCYFVLGIILSDIYVNCSWIYKKRNEIVNTIITIIGYVIMSYSFCFLNDEVKFSRVILGIGMLFFFHGIMISKVFSLVLGNALMERLGSISFSAYILHWPIIEIVSCNLFIWLYNNNYWNRAVGVLLFIITVIVTILISSGWKRYIEPIGMRLFLWIKVFIEQIDKKMSSRANYR